MIQHERAYSRMRPDRVEARRRRRATTRRSSATAPASWTSTRRRRRGVDGRIGFKPAPRPRRPSTRIWAPPCPPGRLRAVGTRTPTLRLVVAIESPADTVYGWRREAERRAGGGLSDEQVRTSVGRSPSYLRPLPGAIRGGGRRRRRREADAPRLDVDTTRSPVRRRAGGASLLVLCPIVQPHCHARAASAGHLVEQSMASGSLVVKKKITASVCETLASQEIK